MLFGSGQVGGGNSVVSEVKGRRNEVQVPETVCVRRLCKETVCVMRLYV